jgi:hypothetical protein
MLLGVPHHCLHGTGGQGCSLGGSPWGVRHVQDRLATALGYARIAGRKGCPVLRLHPFSALAGAQEGAEGKAGLLAVPFPPAAATCGLLCLRYSFDSSPAEHPSREVASAPKCFATPAPHGLHHRHRQPQSTSLADFGTRLLGAWPFIHMELLSRQSLSSYLRLHKVPQPGLCTQTGP